jgi:hypothetical protein
MYQNAMTVYYRRIWNDRLEPEMPTRRLKESRNTASEESEDICTLLFRVRAVRGCVF